MSFNEYNAYGYYTQSENYRLYGSDYDYISIPLIEFGKSISISDIKNRIFNIIEDNSLKNIEETSMVEPSMVGTDVNEDDGGLSLL